MRSSCLKTSGKGGEAGRTHNIATGVKVGATT
jgi:hypothetical protein